MIIPERKEIGDLTSDGSLKPSSYWHGEIRDVRRQEDEDDPVRLHAIHRGTRPTYPKVYGRYCGLRSGGSTQPPTFVINARSREQHCGEIYIQVTSPGRCRKLMPC
jgi:hypothetical protein